MFRSKAACLGFAIGTDTVRVVELTRAAGALGICRLAAQPIHHDPDEHDEGTSLAIALSQLRARYRSWPRRAAAALPASRVLMKRIELSAMDDVALSASVGWEAERQLDIDHNEFRIDYHAMNDEGAEPRAALLAAVRKDFADACTAAFLRARFEVSVLDAAPAALHNVYVANYSTPQALLVDGDGEALTLHVVRESQPLLTRTVMGAQTGETGRAIEAAVAESGLGRECPVLVSGPAFRDPRRVSALAERLAMTVSRLNPLQQIPAIGAQAVDVVSASEFAVAIGAALRVASE
jgi:Tfp pilus assembly PilM family ATPase